MSDRLGTNESPAEGHHREALDEVRPSRPPDDQPDTAAPAPALDDGAGAADRHLDAIVASDDIVQLGADQIRESSARDAGDTDATLPESYTSEMTGEEFRDKMWEYHWQESPTYAAMLDPQKAAERVYESVTETIGEVLDAGNSVWENAGDGGENDGDDGNDGDDPDDGDTLSGGDGGTMSGGQLEEMPGMGDTSGGAGFDPVISIDLDDSVGTPGSDVESSIGAETSDPLLGDDGSQF